jgi:hypothetical protein
MQMPIRIPDVDPLPLPGPVWLFKFLLLFTFTLHLVAMNCALAGGAAALLNAIRGRISPGSPTKPSSLGWKPGSPMGLHPFSRRLASELARMLPTFLALTITLGVAVLLFVQVLYGNLLYTSSILIAAFWLSVIVLVMVAYYGYYYFEARQAATGGAIAAASIAVLCLLAVAFIFSNNMTLVLTPARWLAMYRAHPDGVNLNLAERSLLPRYLHMLVGSVAVVSAATCHIACHRLKTEAEYGGWLLRRWALVFAAATGVQFLLGLWFLMALPRSVALYFFSNGLGATVFGFALLGALGAMILVLVGGHAARPARFVHAGFGLTIITVALMVVMRQMVRTAYLHPYAQPESLATAPQTGIILLFFVLFVLGLATVGYILRLLARAKKRSAETPVQAAGV